MKKVVINLMLLIVFVLLVGCLDYKSYDLPADEQPADDTELINEIAEIERQLEEQDNKELDLDSEEVDNLIEDSEVIEEVIIPELDEPIVDDNLQIITVKENELVNLKVKVTDPDKDKVNYSFSKPLDQAGKWKTSYGDAGEYIITITATDGVLTTEKKVKIVVERVNVAPIISGIKDLYADEGKTVNFEPEVNDPNSDAVTVVVSEPLKSGTFATDHTSAGEYKIKVTASDGELETEKTFKLVVNDVNVLPEVKGLHDFNIKEGDIVKIEPQVSDLDEDEITLTISDPVGNDGIWETAFTDHGKYTVTIVADDGKDKVTKKVQIVIEDVNMPPEIVEVSLAVN
jgi:hypothetical protein